MKGLYALVGMKHRGSEAIVAALPKGTPLALIREPTNLHDPSAVQVWVQQQSEENHIGFIKATQVRALASRMDADPDFAAKMRSGVAACLVTDGGKWPMVEVEE